MRPTFRFPVATSVFLALAVTVCRAAQADESQQPPGLLKRKLSALELIRPEPADTEETAQQLSAKGNESTWMANEADGRLPHADNQGRLQGTSVSERIRAIRRRSVETDISQPFLVVDPREAEEYEVEHFGDLPAVLRRPLGKEGDADGAPKSAEPTPAAQEPSPAPAERVPDPPVTALNTKRMRSDSDVLLTNRAPALSFETEGPRRVIIGREATYRVAMINMGQVDARNVIVSVKLPPWAEVASSSASVGSPQMDTDVDQHTVVSWSISHLPARGRETLVLNIVPRDSRPFDLAVGWAFAPEHSMAQIEVQEPKLEISINGPDEIQYGETEIYTVTLANPGTGTAENVVLNLLPIVAQQQVAGSRSIGPLRAGERKSIAIELTAHQAGRLQVKAMAHAEGGLRSEVSQDVTVRRAHLELVLLGPPRNFAATSATYKIRVENTGDATAEDAVLVASLPAGAQFISSTDGGKFEEAKGQVQWHVGSLRPGAVRVLELRCELNSPGDNRLDVQCQASRDLSVARSLVTRVEALADLKLFVNDPKGAIAIGQEAVYEVKVVNRGTKIAEGVQVVTYFSEGIEPVEVRGWRGEVETGQVVMQPVEVIAPGQEVVFRITARAHQPGNHVFRAELQCGMPETRLAAEEWTKYYSPEDVAGQESTAAEETKPYTIDSR